MHSQINISSLSLSINKKELISKFSTVIRYGAKIAIIGNNGSGKSSLLKLLASLSHNYLDEITCGNDLIIGYVPQIILDYDTYSGGERFNKALSRALSKCPNLLLLDEPTNHLDTANRKSLFNLLNHNSITQIIVSHDSELLNMVNIIWHIHNNEVTIYNGNYASYLVELEINKNRRACNLAELKKAKLSQHNALMKEQHRAKKSREKGEKSIEQRKWPTITSKTKMMRAGITASQNLRRLNSLRHDLDEQLDNIWIPEDIHYSFQLSAKPNQGAVVTIHNGECGYVNSSFKLTNLNINLDSCDKLAIRGNNGSGKSTLVKAILRENNIWCDGEWIVIPQNKIAYFDQHYSYLPSESTVFDYISSISSLGDKEIRSFLNQFLFRKNEEVFNQIKNLSGGEKARLSLASIALNNPELLILDEITNNIDFITRNHVIDVLKHYSGAMIVISHDAQFINELQITTVLNL